MPVKGEAETMCVVFRNLHGPIVGSDGFGVWQVVQG